MDAVLAFSEAKNDNLLAGMNAHDYTAFLKDFDEAMLKAMTQAQFDSLKQDRDEKLGMYVSRKVNRVVQSGDFYAVVYDTVFEKVLSTMLSSRRMTPSLCGWCFILPNHTRSAVCGSTNRQNASAKPYSNLRVIGIYSPNTRNRLEYSHVYC